MKNWSVSYCCNIKQESYYHLLDSKKYAKTNSRRNYVQHIHSSFGSLIPQTAHSNTIHPLPLSLILLHNEPKSPFLARK